MTAAGIGLIVADAAISAGVAMLVVDGVFVEGGSK